MSPVCDTCGTVTDNISNCPVCSQRASESTGITWRSADAGGNHPLDAMTMDESESQPQDSALHDNSRGIVKSGNYQEFGNYILREEIARGGMGVVYRAEQKSLNRTVALKTIIAGYLASNSELERFRVEAESVGRLNHPGIVPIFEAGEHEGIRYLCMEFVHGESLAERLNRGPLGAEEAAGISLQIASAVAHAHSRDVIHRDLKPGSVLIDETGTARLTDFGLARRMESASDLTQSGQVIGTACYMSPEQAAGEANVAGPQTDIYGIGAMLYAMLAGRPPFYAASPLETIRQVQEQTPIPLRQHNRDIPKDLETICLKCLEKRATARYQQADELVAELTRFAHGEPILARPVSTTERALRWVCRNKSIASLVALLIIAVIGGFTGIVLQWNRAEHNAGKESEQRHKAENLAKFERQAKLKALAATEQAVAARQQLEVEHQKVLSQKNRIRQLLYSTQMQSLGPFFADGKMAQMRKILESWRPHNSESDLRELTWHYWNQQLRHFDDVIFERGTEVHDVAVSSNGQLMAISMSHRIAMVRLPTGEVVWEKPIRFQHALRIRFFPDDESILAYNGSSSLAEFDTKTGKVERTFQASFQGFIPEFELSPDGNRVLLASQDGTVELLELDGDSRVPLLSGTGDRIRCLGFAREGRDAIVFGTDIKRFPDCDPGQEETLLARRACSDYALAESGNILYAIEGYTPNPIIYQIDLRPDKPRVTPLARLQHPAQSIALSSNGKSLVAGGNEWIVIRDLEANRELQKFRAHRRTKSVRFANDRLYSAGDDGTVCSWKHLAPSAERSAIQCMDFVTALTYSPDGKLLAIGDNSGRTIIVDATNGVQVQTLTLDGPILDISFTPDSSLMGISHLTIARNQDVGMWDEYKTGDWQRVSRIQGQGSLRGHVSYTSNNELFYLTPDFHLMQSSRSSNSANKVNLPEQRGKPILEQQLRSFLVASDKKTLIAHELKSKLLVKIDLSNGKPIQTLDAEAFQCVYSPTGSMIARSATNGHQVTIHTSASFREIMTIPTASRSMAFDATESTLVTLESTGFKTPLRFWDLRTGELITEIETGVLPSNVALSPKNRSVCFSTADNVVHLIPTSPPVLNSNRRP